MKNLTDFRKTVACERQTFLLAHRRWGTFREENRRSSSRNVPQWRWARRNVCRSQASKTMETSVNSRLYYPFKSHNPLTDSQDWSPYITLRNTFKQQKTFTVLA